MRFLGFLTLLMLFACSREENDSYKSPSKDRIEPKIDTTFDLMTLQDSDTFNTILRKTYFLKYSKINKSRTFWYNVKLGTDYFKFYEYSELPHPPYSRIAPAGDYQGDSVSFERDLSEVMNNFERQTVAAYIIVSSKSTVGELKSVLRASQRVLKSLSFEKKKEFFLKANGHSLEKYGGFTFHIE